MDQDAAILQMMADVREDIRTGFSHLNTKLDAHIESTNDKFEQIRIQQATDKGAAETKAKLWGFAGAGLSTMLAGSWELAKYVWHR